MPIRPPENPEPRKGLREALPDKLPPIAKGSSNTDEFLAIFESRDTPAARKAARKLVSEKLCYQKPQEFLMLASISGCKREVQALLDKFWAILENPNYDDVNESSDQVLVEPAVEQPPLPKQLPKTNGRRLSPSDKKLRRITQQFYDDYGRWPKIGQLASDVLMAEGFEDPNAANAPRGQMCGRVNTAGELRVLKRWEGDIFSIPEPHEDIFAGQDW